MPTSRSFTSMFALILITACLVRAQDTTDPYLTGTLGSTNIEGNGTGPDEYGKWMIQSTGIRAYFIPFGASITNLLINDTNGVERDVVLGYDNASDYSTMGYHFGGVPGRYANRIMNSTFNVHGYTYNTTGNVPNTNTTQDGGPSGWDHRYWTVVAHTTLCITFSLHDADGEGGFPGEVMAYVTYTITPSMLYTRIVAMSLTKVTPIMLTSNVYWNLDGFQNPDTSTVLNHTLNLPYSGQRVDIDTLKIPTGNILPNQLYSVNDFWSHSTGKQLGRNLTKNRLDNNCGQNCTGYDNCFLINREAAGPFDWLERGPVATLKSAFTNINLNVFTDQDALQVYTCNGMASNIPLKQTQRLPKAERAAVVDRYGCVALAVEDWIGGVNQPAWQRDPKQNYGPQDKPYVLQAAYSFKVPTATPHCTATSTSTVGRTTTVVSTTETTTTGTVMATAKAKAR